MTHPPPIKAQSNRSRAASTHAWPAVPFVCICIFDQRLARYHQIIMHHPLFQLSFLPPRRQQQSCRSVSPRQHIWAPWFVQWFNV